MSRQISYIILLIIVSCLDRNNKPDQMGSIYTYKPDSVSLKLNNKAVVLIGEAAHTYDTLKGVLYDSAITYLNQAIEIDSMYLLAYTNKAQALQRKGSLEDAVRVLNQVEMLKPDFVDAIMGQGFILEKLGRMGSANEKYKQALKAFKIKLANDPKNIKLQSDIAFLTIFLEDKNAALDEIQDLILRNPDNEQLKMVEGVIKDFDRNKFIDEY